MKPQNAKEFQNIKYQTNELVKEKQQDNQKKRVAYVGRPWREQR